MGSRDGRVSRRFFGALAATAIGMLGVAGPASATDFPADAGSLGAIPDHAAGCNATGGTPRNVTFTVTGVSSPITDVKVSFSMNPLQDWVGDMGIVLIAPNGAQHTILSRTGSTTATGCGDSTDVGVGPYTFWDGAAAPPNGGWWQTATLLTATVPMTSGTYRTTAPGGASAINPSPATSMNPAFAGVPNPNGTWTLQFQDHGGGGIGTVAAATLSLTGFDVTAPAPPSLTGTTPTSPANDNAPRVQGSAEAGSTITVFTTGDCTGPSVSGTEAQLESAGIAVAVAADTSSSISAKATDAATNASGCSSPITYTEDSTPPAAPSLTGTTPPSPANENSPKLRGSAEADSQISIYSGNCAGVPLVTAAEALLEDPGIGLTAVENTVTSLSAKAVDAANNPSACSNLVTYVEDSAAPDTRIDKAKVKKRKATVSFSSLDSDSTFRCKLDKDAFATCTSPLKLKHLKPGRHAFAVEAKDAAGNLDASPATKKLKVKKPH